MNIYKKILDGLSRDSWAGGTLGDGKYVRCLAWHVWYARTGTDYPSCSTAEIDQKCADDLLVLHKIICEQ